MLKAQVRKTMRVPASPEEGYWQQSEHFKEVVDNIDRMLNHGTEDAKREYDGLTFEITKQHIDEGVCGDTSLCALALSIADEFGVWHSQVKVEGVAVGVYDPSYHKEIFGAQLSDALVDWILAFDEARGVQPVRIIVKVKDMGNGYSIDIL